MGDPEANLYYYGMLFCVHCTHHVFGDWPGSRQQQWPSRLHLHAPNHASMASTVTCVLPARRADKQAS